MEANRIDDGGPAFPLHPEHDRQSEECRRSGMSLMDYIAIEVVSAAIARDGMVDYVFDGLETDVYRIAANMIAEKRRIEGESK